MMDKKTSDPKKCAHAACSCMVDAGKKFCSQICEDSKSVTHLSCHCGHAGCDESVR
jgi:hypothetical protein